MSGASARVLVLDDEPMILMDVRAALEAAGFDAVTARSCDKALSLIEDRRPSAAVLDVNLGRGETCEAVAERPAAMDVPFVLHSGDLDRLGELITRLDRPIVRKPARGERVAEAVRALLEGEG